MRSRRINRTAYLYPQHKQMYAHARYVYSKLYVCILQLVFASPGPHKNHLTHLQTSSPFILIP
ncbi:Protein of unknown function [Pyronema omphalodes CBS 100304]|uniref:Uncharacterized protein n=1 Tax=Pyronema omphalodes (strain CBS 100304) TaxID=1076935 RepID=U4LJ62_PYROM|nr:Protein of unknown function [Pyronema omphalodes CBS 100304]